jgi:tetratricopeptide (TPR) repeat protein
MTLDLGQIACALNHRYEIVDVEENRLRVDALLDLTLSSEPESRHPRIAVLPELGMSKAFLPEVIDRFSRAPRGRLLVAGLDRTTAGDARAIVARYGMPDEDQAKFLNPLPDHTLVNTTAVIARGRERQADLKLLFKHGSSIYETTGPHSEQHIHGPHYMQLFRLRDFYFAVLTCSDMFTRPPREPVRLIDEFNYRLWRGANQDKAPVLLINHQRTPDTNDHRFVESLRRLYDGAADERGSARNLCTVMLNQAEEIVMGGGESLVVLHRDKSPKLNQAAEADYDWLEAPVSGYRAPKDEVVMTVSMRCPDHSLTRQEEPDSLSIDFSTWDRNCWASDGSLRCRHVIEADALPVHHASIMDVAEGFAEHQQFGAAIKWAERAFDIASRRDYFRRAQARFTMAVNARRAGDIERADSLFGEAAGQVEKGVEKGDDEVDSRLLTLAWHIRFARRLLTQEVRDPYPRHALLSLDELENEALEEGFAERVDGDIDLYKARLARQRGDLLMLLGHYPDAFDKYRDSFQRYGWESSSEKALACSGLAHAGLMLGRYEGARDHVRELRRYLQVAPDSRVRWRYLRFMCVFDQLARGHGAMLDVREQHVDPEQSLLGLTQQASFRAEALHSILTLGAIALERSPSEALARFAEAENLADARPNAEPLTNPRRPTPNPGNRMPLERMYALLGQADAHRLAGDRDKAREMYRKTHTFFKQRELRWGLERARLGAWLCAGQEGKPPSQADAVGRGIVESIANGVAFDRPIFVCFP